MAGTGSTRPRLPIAAGPQLLYGHHAVEAALLNPARRFRTLAMTEAGLQALRPALAEARRRGLARPEPLIADRIDLERLLARGAVHQGVVAEVAELEELAPEDLPGLVEAGGAGVLFVVLDQVTDPQNAGAVLRSAAAFGAAALILTRRESPPQTGALAKAASGALELVPMLRVPNLAQTVTDLNGLGVDTIGLAEEGPETLAATIQPGPLALVMGAEGEGLRQLTRRRCRALASLPTGPKIGGHLLSLNVSAAAAIALYEARRRV